MSELLLISPILITLAAVFVYRRFIAKMTSGNDQGRVSKRSNGG